jgi:hypothetical protein
MILNRYRTIGKISLIFVSIFLFFLLILSKINFISVYLEPNTGIGKPLLMVYQLQAKSEPQNPQVKEFNGSSYN